MRHILKHRKLSRTSSHRKALLRNMSISLLRYERIRTTLAKAKELRPFVEKLVTKGRKNQLYIRRNLLSVLCDKVIVTKLMNDISVRFKERSGGYLRILKNGFRHGDSAPMAIIEFIDYNPE
ncbi:MAG: 50S ribosomal protein L17 [Rickettsiaceae bacterium H1]|nr:50S ribosomal protein L17 [Rickettsiaceae bacterium H1]